MSVVLLVGTVVVCAVRFIVAFYSHAYFFRAS